MATPTLEEKLDKIRSPNLQSQEKTVVVLKAVEATLAEHDTPKSPTGYFAALLSLLNKTGGRDRAAAAINAEQATPVVYLLDIVTPYTPPALLRSMFTQILGLLAPVLLLPDAEAILIRSSVGCVESLLLAQDSAAWDLPATEVGPRRAVAGLLELSLDHRPKVRKRAQDSIRKILQNPPPSPSLDHPAADMCAHTAMKSLKELAAGAAKGGKDKARRHQKGTAAGAGAGDGHDPALLHALQMIKTVAAARTGWPGQKIEPLCELLLGISRVGNEHMILATFQIFEKIFQGLEDEIASVKLPSLMAAVSDLRPAAADAHLVPSWLAVFSRGCEASALAEPEETFHNLPALLDTVMPFMKSPSREVQVSGSECIISLLSTCVPTQVIVEPSVYDEMVLEKIGKAVQSLWTVQYHTAIEETFNITGALFDALRWRAYPIIMSLVEVLGKSRREASSDRKEQIDPVLGRAIRAVGPEAVLAVLPLNMTGPSTENDRHGRAWLLPMLRDHTANTNLAHFRSEIVPLSEAMFQKILDHGEADKTVEVKIYETVIQQAWSTFPGYCDLPLDLAAAFDRPFAELLTNLLYNQVDLRLDICRGLRMLVESNKAITEIDYADGEDEDLILQRRITKAAASANLDHLAQFSANMLAVLFNVYTQTLPQSRGPILQTINAFLGITPAPALLETFDRVSKLLAEELQKRPDPSAKKPAESPDKLKLPPISNTLMDIIITMVPYLPRESFRVVFDIAAELINQEEEPQLQKNAYKLIPRLTGCEAGRTALSERFDQLLGMLLASSDKISAPARRERLAAFEALLPVIPDSEMHIIPIILSEVVICCKENNERARESAYNLLVQMGHRMETATGAVIDSSKVPHMAGDAPNAVASLEEYLTMASAGLAGTTPHMISATVTAISHLMYHFRATLSPATLADLVQTMDLFLTSNNREIVKSVLGFVKVSVISLPTEIMVPRLSSLVPNLIIWSNEHKAHFKSKVKHILERMIRKFGFDVVNQNCPEAERRLIISVRKAKERSKKKKDEVAAATAEDGEDSDGEEAGPSRKFESEYDEALYSSDSEDSGDEKGRGGGGGGTKTSRKMGKKQQHGGGHKERNTYIVEDEDEPLDLLDKKALANISSTKPAKVRKPTKSKANYNLDGKLIIGKAGDGDKMEVDKTGGDGEGESGIGAYVAALKGRDAPRRGRTGKLKFSNRRTKDDDNDRDTADHKDEDDVERRDGRPKSKQHGGSGGRGGRGGRGYQGGRGGGRSGKGGIGAGRRGLGEEKRRGPIVGGGIRKGGVGGRRGRR